jgi:sulfatase maturation enzyme AslB (radical SAM superfamily)
MLMNLSVNPTYYCNFRCDFCYLTEDQLSDRTRLPLELLRDRLSEVSKVADIGMVDLYGGEVGLLPRQYIKDMKGVFKEFGIDDINIITNLSMVNETILDPDFYVTVSYDFEAREQHDTVWRNMALLNKEFSILILASQKVLEMDVDSMIQQLNLLGNLVSVEIKPYSTNQANAHPVGNKDFEKFVTSWIERLNIMQFEFVNEKRLRNTINKQANSFSNDHVYITPSGNFGVLEFDSDNNEYFWELDSFERYLDWSVEEQHLVSQNKYCGQCKYFGNCLSEHLREVKSLDDSCNGFINLIEWYDARVEN